MYLCMLLVEDKAFGGGKKALKTKETQLTLLQHKGEHPVHVNTSNKMVWSFVFDSRGVLRDPRSALLRAIRRTFVHVF